jgi:hypothetical protein
MHIDPKALVAITPGQPWISPASAVVKLAEPAALWAVYDGGRVCLGYGADFNLRLPQGTMLMVEEVEGSYRAEADRAVTSEGKEIFTNTERDSMGGSTDALLRNQMAAFNKKLREIARKQAELTRMQKPQVDATSTVTETAEDATVTTEAEDEPTPTKGKGKKEDDKD